jgi:hypothetical protein
MTSCNILVGGVTLVLVCCGCSSNSDPAAESSGGSPGLGGAAGAGAGCSDRPAVSLDDVSGSWALLEIETSVQTSSYMDDFHNQVVSLFRLEQTQTGEGVTAEAICCDRFARQPDGAVRSVMPADFGSMIDPFTWHGTFSQDGSGMGRFQLLPHFFVIGATLDDPSDPSELPTDPTDPRVVDLDANGQPGFTVFLQGAIQGSVDVVQWSSVAMEGRPTATDRIEGLVTFDAQQNVLASEPEFVRNVVAQPIPDSDPCVSFFVMARVPEGDDCAAITAQRATLFPGLPAGQ